MYIYTQCITIIIESQSPPRVCVFVVLAGTTRKWQYKTDYFNELSELHAVFDHILLLVWRRKLWCIEIWEITDKYRWVTVHHITRHHNHHRITVMFTSTSTTYRTASTTKQILLTPSRTIFLFHFTLF